MGRRGPQVAFEVGHLGDGLHLAQDALFASGGDELALMGGDGAEGASAEASAVEAHGELDHLVGWDALALVLGVGQTRVGQVEGAVELVLSEWLVGGIDHGEKGLGLLYDGPRLIFVRFLLDVAEVLGLGTLVAETFLVAVEHDVVGTDAAGNLIFI